MREYLIRDHLDMSDQWEMITTTAHKGLDGGPVLLTLGRPKRTLSQNSKMWPMLRDISQQLKWLDQPRSEYYWKNLLMWLFQEAEWVPGLNGELVPMSMNTSDLSAARFREFIELIYAWGSEQGVEWSGQSEHAHRTHGVKDGNR